MRSLIDYRGSPVIGGDARLDAGPVTPAPFGAEPVSLLRPLRRHWLLGIVATIVLGVLATAIVLAVPNRYQSMATVLIEAHPDQVVNIANVVPSGAVDDLQVDSQIQILRSPSLAGQVIDRLQLGDVPEFREGMFTGWLAHLLNHSATAPDRVELTDRFLRELNVERRGKSLVLQVAFTARDPGLAARIVNTLVATYLDNEVGRRVKATQQATALLDQKLAQLRADVAAKEQAVEGWRARSGLIRGATGPAVDEQISQANAALAVARDEYAQAQARQQSGGGDSSNAVVNNVLIQHLREQQSDLDRRIAELSAVYGPRHPTMINLEAERSKLNASIAAETAKVNSGLGQQLRVAGARVADLEATVQRLRAQSDRDSDAQVKLRAFEREATASRGVLDTYLARYDETKQQASLQTAGARILGQAEPPPRPAFPSRTVLLGVGWIVALGLGGLGVPYLRDTLSTAVSPMTRIEIIERVAGPALAVVPTLLGGNAPRAYNRMIDDPRGDFAEAVGAARAGLLFARPERRCKIVLLTSATAGEGKTVLAASIARSAALAGEDTLLVDVNLRDPGIHRALELSNELGVVDYLERGIDIEALIQIDPRSPLEIMPAGQGSLNAPPLLTLAALTRLFDELRARYHLVVLDGPALLAGIESRFLASAVDEVVLVTSAELSPQALSFALRQLNEAHVASLRVLINRVDLPALHEGVAVEA